MHTSASCANETFRSCRMKTWRDRAFGPPILKDLFLYVHALSLPLNVFQIHYISYHAIATSTRQAKTAHLNIWVRLGTARRPYCFLLAIMELLWASMVATIEHDRSCEIGDISWFQAKNKISSGRQCDALHLTDAEIRMSFHSWRKHLLCTVLPACLPTDISIKHFFY